jgi:hypothetical protein
MLTNTSENLVISSLGWVDGGGLWTFRVDEQRPRRVTLGHAKYLTLHAGTDDHFSVVHHDEGSRVEITVHHFHDLGAPLGRAVVAAEGSTVSGPPSVWSHVRTNYTAFYKGSSWSDYALVRVDPITAKVSLQQFDWYNDEYDKGYQGIVGVTEIPGDSLLLIAVQRDSRLVLYDPAAQAKRGLIELAARGGNPSLFFRLRARELWAVDYDTILKLDPSSWRVLASRRLQAGDSQGTTQFIGNAWFNRGETMCVVARPFSGDVIVVDPDNLKTRFRCQTGQQPLQAVALADGQVVARDWKTGELLQGQLRKVGPLTRLWPARQRPNP